MDKCANCQRSIGNLEEHRIFSGKVVCLECDTVLRKYGRCANCEKPITKFEAASIFNGKVVCPQCDALLRGGGRVTPVTMAVSVQTPVVIDTSQHKRTSGLGIAALVLGILACLTCWIPFFGLIIIPMAGIGLVLGIIGIIAAALTKKTHASMAIAGCVVCVLAIVVSIAVSATAVVGLPSRIDQAKWSEARAAASTIVTALRAYGAERGTDGAWRTMAGMTMTDPATGNTLGITAADLDGAYFDARCYTITSCSWDDKNGLSCVITVDAAVSPKAGAPTSVPTKRSLVVVHGQFDSASTLTPF